MVFKFRNLFCLFVFCFLMVFYVCFFCFLGLSGRQAQANAKGSVV